MPARPRQGHGPRHNGARSWRRQVWVLAIPVAAAVVGGRAAASGHARDVGPWGLVQALPWPYFAALAVLSLSFVVSVFRRPEEITGPAKHLALAAHVISLVFLLHGAPALLEAEPRFATAWLHAGFTDQILVHGVGRPDVDARFSWPGFFAAAATVAGAAGVDDPVSLLRWAPTVAVLLYLPPLYLIARHLTRSARAAWLALFLFVPVNWVGQDYYAPQTVGFVLYLASVALLVLYFRGGRQMRLVGPLTRWRDRLPFDGEPDLPSSGRLRVVLVGVVLLLTAATALSHQLTPMMLVFTSAALVLAGRLRLATLPVLALLLAIGWLSLGATAYWVGHLGAIFGNLGNLAAAFGGVKARVGGSPEHLAIVRLRLLSSAATWALMGAAALVLWLRHRRPPVTLLALAVAPVAALSQPYGGEAMMRVFLFSSPFACMIVAQALFAVRWHKGARTLLVAFLVLVTLPLFLVIRYGNESFERVRPGEVRAVQALYDIAPLGSNIISPTSQVPWRSTHAADYDYGRPTDALGFRAGDLEAVRGLVGNTDAPATYLVVTRGQVVYATQALGEPEGWFRDRVRPQLKPVNGYRLVYRNRAALVYEFLGPRP